MFHEASWDDIRDQVSIVARGVEAAAGILVILPPAIAALLFRKFLIRGMTGGSPKGERIHRSGSVYAEWIPCTVICLKKRDSPSVTTLSA